MTNPRLTPPPTPAVAPVGWWDRLAIISLGGAGCALSYDALQQMAVAIHVRPQLSYLFPLVIDGFIAYGIRALLVMSTAPLRARLYVWTLFGTATTASIWANALHAVRLNQQSAHPGLRLTDNVVAVLSTIAPLALAGAVHLYILITRHHPNDRKSTRTGGDQHTGLVGVWPGLDGTIRTAPLTRARRADRPDRTRLRAADHTAGQFKAADQGSSERSGHGPADQSTGPHADHETDRTADQRTGPDRRGGDHSGPAARGPADHDAAGPDRERGPAVRSSGPGRDAEPSDRSADHPDHRTTGHADADRHGSSTVDQTAGSGLQAPVPEQREIPAGQRAESEGGADRTGGPDHDRTRVADEHGPDQGSGPQRGPADHTGTADGPGPRQGTSGADHPADHAPGDHRGGDHRGPAVSGQADHDRGDHPGTGPRQGTGIPGPTTDSETGDHSSADHGGPADREKRTGPEQEGEADQAGTSRTEPRSPDRPVAGTAYHPSTVSAEAGSAGAEESVGVEVLLPIARAAALAEGRMTRRALRPYLNKAGVPISNRRFTQLQRHLYADPTLAHLPRPNDRSRK